MNVMEYRHESVQLYLVGSDREIALPTYLGGVLRVTHVQATWVRRGAACQMVVNLAGRRIEKAGALGGGVQLWCPADQLPAWITALLAPSAPVWWTR